MRTTTAQSTASFTLGCGTATSWAVGYTGTGTSGLTTPTSARPRVQDLKLMFAVNGANVWPSSRSGRCTG